MLDEFKEFYDGVKGFRDVLEDKKDYDVLRDYIKLQFPLFDKLILCSGQENIVKEGPNIIVVNSTGYLGTGRSIIGLLRAYDKQLHFVATKYLFNKEASIKKAKEKLGSKTYGLLEVTVNRYAKLISERMTAFDMIPADLDYEGDNTKKVSSQREVMNTIKDHLKKDKLVKLDDMVINIASMPMGEKGRTNMMKLSYIG